MFEKVSSTNYFKFYDSNLLTSMYHPLPLPMRAQMLVKPRDFLLCSQHIPNNINTLNCTFFYGLEVLLQCIRDCPVLTRCQINV